MDSLLAEDLAAYVSGEEGEEEVGHSSLTVSGSDWVPDDGDDSRIAESSHSASDGETKRNAMRDFARERNYTKRLVVPDAHLTAGQRRSARQEVLKQRRRLREEEERKNAEAQEDDATDESDGCFSVSDCCESINCDDGFVVSKASDTASPSFDSSDWEAAESNFDPEPVPKLSPPRPVSKSDAGTGGTC